MAVIADAADEWPGEVEAVVVPSDRDRHLPAGRGRVARHRLDSHPGPARHGQRGPVRTAAAQRDVDVLMAGPARLRPAGAARQLGALDHHGYRPGHGTRPAGGAPRRGRRRVLVVGAPHQVADLVVHVLGPPQRDPHRGTAAVDVPGALQPAARLGVVKTQAQVHPVPGGRPHHGEGSGA